MGSLAHCSGVPGSKTESFSVRTFENHKKDVIDDNSKNIPFENSLLANWPIPGATSADNRAGHQGEGRRVNIPILGTLFGFEHRV